MWFSWHGSASFSLKLGNKEIVVDPSFSQGEDYGPWYMANTHAPDFTYYFKNYSPDYVFITHGHFDHFDLETVKKIDNINKPKFVGSPEVTEALMEYFNIPVERLLSIKPGFEIKLNGDFALSAYLGEHFLTGEEGTKAAMKLKGRHERYGVMPCGGPMLQYIIKSSEGNIYISGDTLLEGIPEEVVDIAFMDLGGPITHPTTKEKYKAAIDSNDAVEAIEHRLKPRYIIPLHYDFQYMEPIDIEDFQQKATATSSHPKVIIPAFNTWVEVDIKA